MATKEQLLAVLRPRATDDGWRWLTDAVAATADGELSRLLRAYTAASRHMGASPLGESAPGSAATDLAGWTLEDAARAVLLLSRAEGGQPETFVTAASACYEQGDAREQRSWLKAVGLLPEPERFLSLVVDACRTSIQPVFEAVACENPYPAQYFPDRNFNQLVLKAMFNGVSLARIVGLHGRLNPELSRMALDYAAERRAAGRPVPEDIHFVVTDPGGSPDR
jgi:hypothetical protein